MNKLVHILLGTAVLPKLRVVVLLLCACTMSHRVGAADAKNDQTKTLAESLGGTKWLWYGREDQVLEFRRDGKFVLAAWAEQAIAATWRATGPNEVTVTVTSQKFRNLTATLIFNDDLSLFTGTDLDKNRAIAKSPRVAPPVESTRELTQALGGTQWLWYGRENQVLEFRRDGKFELPAWAEQGITATWRAIGRKEVTVTVTSKKFKNLTATLIFSDDLTSFTGTDLDKNRKISNSPRVGR